jgi:hypothetical protein
VNLFQQVKASSFQVRVQGRTPIIAGGSESIGKLSVCESLERMGAGS